MKHSSSFDELIDAGRIAGLGSNSPKYEVSEYKLPVQGGFIEVTLNFPRVDKFVSLCTSKQKELYAKLWREAQGTFDPINVKHTEYTIELCDSGHCHLHGIIFLCDTYKCIPLGCVADLVKRVLANFPHKKGYDRYNDKSMFIEYCRYKSPGIVANYYYRDDMTEFNRWYSYMYKEQATAPQGSSTGKKGK